MFFFFFFRDNVFGGWFAEVAVDGEYYGNMDNAVYYVCG